MCHLFWSYYPVCGAVAADFIKHMQAMVCTTEMTGSCCPICRAVIADDIKMYKP